MAKMTRLHIVTGDKGNAGKSAWCTAMIEYYRGYGKSLKLVDADGDSQTLSKVYESAFPLVLSDDISYAHLADSIYEMAYTEAKKKTESGDVLVDLPAGGEKFISKWIDECAIPERADEDRIIIFKWWVCDSDARSIELFQASVEKYPSIKHIFLKNMGRSAIPQWASFDADEDIQALVKAKKITVLEIPSIPPVVLDDLRAAKAKLIDVFNDKNYKQFGLSNGMRVKGWVSMTGHLLSSVVPLKKKKMTTKKTVAATEQPNFESEQIAESEQTMVATEQTPVPATV